MLSARGEEVDRIVGLEVGADDYLAKPFNPRELLARIRAVLRRRAATETPSAPAEVFAFGPFRLDYASHTLTRDSAVVALTTGEYTLLRVMTGHPNRALSRDQLIELLKGYDRSPFDRSIDVRVTRLRRKIEDDPENPRYVRTVWGTGYMFVPSG
jgi:DNA-binding response OmpR family regulator